MKLHAVGFAPVLLLACVPVSLAAESGHSQHAPAPPAQIVAAPASGKARESGFDGNDLMESTSAENATGTQCAHAVRGLVMLDRAALAQCSGAAAPVAAPSAPAHQHH